MKEQVRDQDRGPFGEHSGFQQYTTRHAAFKWASMADTPERTTWWRRPEASNTGVRRTPDQRLAWTAEATCLRRTRHLQGEEAL